VVAVKVWADCDEILVQLGQRMGSCELVQMTDEQETRAVVGPGYSLSVDLAARQSSISGQGS
jgi:hypothetical protein